MMKKTLLLLILLMTACQPAAKNITTSTLPASTVSPPATSTVKPIAVSTKPIQLAWFTKPPQASDMDVVAKNFDLFILTHKDEEARDQLRAQKVGSSFLQYLTLIEIQERDCSNANPYGNQVAYKEGDFCQISQNHPDWFILDNNGNRIISGGDYFYMDPGNLEYRAFWVERAREMHQQYGWDGLFIDNVEASLKKFRDLNQIPAKYQTDIDFQQAMDGFLLYIKQSFQSSIYPVIGNIVSIEDNTIWRQYASELDGVMSEDFAVGWSSEGVSESEWDYQKTEMEWALNGGKSLILVSQGEQSDEKRQQFAFASYLLINDGNAFFRYANADDYRAVWLYPNYNIQLGTALGPSYRNGNSWQRDFEHGSISVTPSTMESEIKITQ